MRVLLSRITVWVFLALFGITVDVAAQPLPVHPETLALQGPFAQSQLLVQQLETPDGADHTAEAQYRSADERIARVDSRGRVLALANGQTTIHVTWGDRSREIPVTVSDVSEPLAVSYREHISPILSKAGCNAGACHASQHGKGGLVLSVLGYDPQADHAALVRDRDGRRVNLLDPDASLILLKPTMQVAHGGGKRLEKDSIDYQMLLAWLSLGAPAPHSDSAEITQLEVLPKHRVGPSGMQQQLRVEATYSDGRKRDVTAWAKYDSLDDGVVAVDAQGQVTSTGQGQAAIMVRYEGQANIAMFVIPYASSAPLADWQHQNFVDELAVAKFKELGLEPSPRCDDATFVRRVFLDCIGTQPTPEETLAFLQSQDPQKRERLVDRLLGLTGDPQQDTYKDAYAAFWTLKWADLVRNTSRELGDQGMWALHNWLQEGFRSNKPFDQMVRELVTAKGSIYSNGPANYFLINKSSTDLAESTAQLFLGVRLECAKCHHHPFEKYSQADYYSFAAFFSRVGSKNSQEFGLFGRERVVLVQPTGEVKHPKTGKVLPPAPLDGPAMDHPLDRRIPLAEWLTAKENRFFARSVVNRYVGYLLGRGLVEPLDDMRSTNPPSNPALMDALAKHFVDSGYDLKQLLRAILVSRLYQLDSQPTSANSWDRRFYSHYYVKRLSAEPLLDAVNQVTGSPTKFQNLPQGTRAIELPDAEYADYFLTTFAKPRRASVCECERPRDENLSQALHTLNGDILSNKIAAKGGRVEALLAAGKPHLEIVDQLYLAALCRLPTDAERQASWSFLDQAPTAKECYEDLLWALLNSKQFLFVR